MEYVDEENSSLERGWLGRHGEDDVKDQIEDLRGEMQQLKKDLMEFTEEKLVSLAEALAEKLQGK